MGTVGIEERLNVGCGSRQQCGRGNRGNDVGGGANTGKLGAREEEELVLENRAADGAAELVPGVGALGDAALGVGDGVGGVGGEAVELPRTAMEGVGAGAGGDGDDTA